MKPRWFRAWWLLLAIPVLLGFARLRFDVEVLNLLPDNVPAVTGVKLYQQQFSNARELIVTIEAGDKEAVSRAAQAIADALRAETNLVAEVIWQPPWLERPELTAELIAHLWFNQPPAVFAQLADQLAPTNLANVLAATRDELSTTLSPMDIARLSYDPFGLTRLPDNIMSAAPAFSEGDGLFASPDGQFRMLFIKARPDLQGYRECTEWLDAIKELTTRAIATNHVTLGFTGRPAFVAEIAASMKHDIVISVFGTAVIIAILFWLAHRRWKPMLWLLTLLGLILAATLGLGGLFFGTINVVSMGFAAILLGLAVDYAVVHYQEALAHPGLTVPQIRRAIAPSIFWAAVTTITAFIVLNFGGLPGLAQLGSLVAIGVAISALVMIFSFLPPLFPDRMQTTGSAAKDSPAATPHSSSTPTINRTRTAIVSAFTALLVLSCGAILLHGLPRLDASAKALEPRDSAAYATLTQIKNRLTGNRDPLWLVVGGRNEQEVADRLALAQPLLDAAISNGTLESLTLPTALWPRPAFQTTNRATALRLASQETAFREAATNAGFSEAALGLTHSLLTTWETAAKNPHVFWPTNPMSSWIFEKFAVHPASSSHAVTNAFYAVGFLFPPTNALDHSAFRSLSAQLPREGVWFAGWGLIGSDMLQVVRQNLWKLVLPMVGLVLLSLWLAFRRAAEILLSLGVLLLSGLCLLAAMHLCGWSWNLLSLMALPLILGTGVDYSLFMQLALRRHGGDLHIAHQSVGRALLLCGGTAIAGFGMLGLSSNAGMASLGQVCAVGIAANMLLAVFVLPVWWRVAMRGKLDAPHHDFGAPDPATAPSSTPSSLYSAKLWSVGLFFARTLPVGFSRTLARLAATLYWRCAPHRRAVVIENLLPVLKGDRAAATARAQKLIVEFALKLVDLWRYEAGVDVTGLKTDWRGWDDFAPAHARGKGVLIVTPHLGNWELGAAFFVKHNIPLLVLTQAEPDAALTQMRQASRSRRGIETLVVGKDPFAFIEIIKRLQAGAAVALLIDRPPAATAVEVNLFGQPFAVSIAAAELARASGCAIVPGVIVRQPDGYSAQLLPEIPYDRASIGNREGRIHLSQQILRVFEPAIREYAEQWYHFVPLWKKPPTHPAPQSKPH